MVDRTILHNNEFAFNYAHVRNILETLWFSVNVSEYKEREDIKKKDSIIYVTKYCFICTLYNMTLYNPIVVRVIEQTTTSVAIAFRGRCGRSSPNFRTRTPNPEGSIIGGGN